MAHSGRLVTTILVEYIYIAHKLIEYIQSAITQSFDLSFRGRNPQASQIADILKV